MENIGRLEAGEGPTRSCACVSTISALTSRAHIHRKHCSAVVRGGTHAEAITLQSSQRSPTIARPPTTFPSKYLYLPLHPHSSHHPSPRHHRSQQIRIRHIQNIIHFHKDVH